MIDYFFATPTNGHKAGARVDTNIYPQHAIDAWVRAGRVTAVEVAGTEAPKDAPKTTRKRVKK